MSQGTKLIDLYSTHILELASNISLTEPIENPLATINRRAPLCGSMVTIELIIKNNQISGYSQDVKACALGQASASILAKHIIGSKTTDILQLRDQLNNLLKSNGAVPSQPFSDYLYLSPAKDYKNRHASILLVLDAVVDGIKQINRS